MTTEEAIPEVDLWRYLRILGRRKWWIISLTILGLLGGAVYAFTAPKKYTTTALLQVEPARGSVSVGNTTPTVAAAQVSTQLQILTSSAVEEAAEQLLHFRPTITANQIGTTDVLSITATASTPQGAALIANTYAKTFVNYQRKNNLESLTAAELEYQQQITTDTNDLNAISTNTPNATALENELTVLKEDLAQLQLEGASTSSGVVVASPAPVPQNPSSPKKGLALIFGGLGGLVLGFILAFITEALDDTVYDQDDLEHLAPGVPVLGQIPMIGTWKDKKTTFLVSLSDPSSIVTEAYRSLRTSLQFASYDDPVQVVLITSPTATDGKTSTVSNLGVMFAMAGQSVVLLSADLRRPRLAQFFGMDEQVGLTSVVIGEATLDEALQPVTGVPGMTLLGAGPIPPNPSELLGSNKMADVVAQLRERFDVIIIDSPPLLPVTDPVILARLADLSLLIVGAGQTKKGQLSRAFQQIAQSGSPRLGIVFNEVRRESDNSYSYSYSYSYKPRQNGNGTGPDVGPDKNGGPAHARTRVKSNDKLFE